MKRFFYCIILISFPLFGQKKLLHLSFHNGCLKEIESIGKALGVEIHSKHCFSCPKEEYDGISPEWSGQRYRLSKQRADAIWKINQKEFEKYDGYIVSDTAPLGRIFLENETTKPLIIWSCNRFDWGISRDNRSPDHPFYALYNSISTKKNVKLIGYTAFESAYAKKQRKVTSFEQIIKPAGFGDLVITQPNYNKVPSNIDKKNTFFIRQYFNENSINLSEILEEYDIPYYHGSYEGSKDLAGFRGSIHIPVVMSNLALFENLNNGLIYFLPSKSFFQELLEKNLIKFIFWCKPLQLPSYKDIFKYSEWYQKEFKDVFIYFDSWKDLKTKIETTNYEKMSMEVKKFAKRHKTKTLNQWKSVFSELDLL